MTVAKVARTTSGTLIAVGQSKKNKALFDDAEEFISRYAACPK